MREQQQLENGSNKTRLVVGWLVMGELFHRYGSNMKKSLCSKEMVHFICYEKFQMNQTIVDIKTEKQASIE